MTDAEVVRTLAQQQGSTCGRFRLEQLNRPLRTYPSASKGQRRWWGLFTAGLFGWHATQAQLIAPQTGAFESSVKTIASQSLLSPTSSIASVDSSRIITGQVVAGPSGKPVSGVTVRVVDTYDYVYTYDTNTFRIAVPAEQATADVILSISHSDYVSLEIVVRPDQQGPLLLTFTEKVVFMGEVAAVKLPEKPSFLDRLRSRLPATH